MSVTNAKVLLNNEFDYSLTGVNTKLAIEKGLAEADWYQCPVPRHIMRCLLERKDGPALRDTALWFALIIGTGYLCFLTWGTWWFLLPYSVYAVLYASTSDSRWHEAGHGTAFKTDWMNNALYEIASFMVMRESTLWRWSHSRHHSDTIIVGRDPEIAAPRSMKVTDVILSFFNVQNYFKYFKQLLMHAGGRLSDEEKTYIPEQEHQKIFNKARLYIFIYLAVIALSLYTQSIFPVLMVGLSNFFGSWLMVIYGLTQHAGLAENVLDHRLNCRTVYMNPINRYLYWNMNYHVEHHMFPLVPYHALPKLHQIIKDDLPTPYKSTLHAWAEIIPAILKRQKDPAYYVKRKLPDAKNQKQQLVIGDKNAQPNEDGWVQVCAASDIKPGEAIRFDHGRKTFALYRDAEANLYATDGICTHGNNHLAEGLVIGKTIECPKHNGRFNLQDGAPVRPPVCRALLTYPVKEKNGLLFMNIRHAGGAGARTETSFKLQVVSNHSVSTFINEIILEPVNENNRIKFEPGDYIQIEIPVYDKIRFSDFSIPPPFNNVWQTHHLFELEASNPSTIQLNNYSLASNPATDEQVRLNVRIAMPPIGQDCPPGKGSAYMFNLKAGDIVKAIGPFGDFHIKPTQREMVYIGGGAGMGPLRSHIAYLLETQNSARKISFWYGARAKQEIFYEDYFCQLANKYSNFSFNIALSSPLTEDDWNGLHGFIHEVAFEQYLKDKDVKGIEFYLCGPPMMIKACCTMLTRIGVQDSQIAFDEF